MAALPWLTGAVVTGCSFDEVRLRAAHDLECASGKLSMTQVDENRLRFAGCGKTATYFCGVDSHGFDQCTREKPNPRAEVQRVAAAELTCPLQIIQIDDAKDTFVATGCGRSAAYACTEVLNGFRCERRGDIQAGPSRPSRE